MLKSLTMIEIDKNYSLNNPLKFLTDEVIGEYILQLSWQSSSPYSNLENFFFKNTVKIYWPKPNLGCSLNLALNGKIHNGDFPCSMRFNNDEYTKCINRTPKLKFPFVLYQNARNIIYSSTIFNRQFPTDFPYARTGLNHPGAIIVTSNFPVHNHCFQPKSVNITND